MPGEVLFATEKERWRREFDRQFIACLNDPSRLALMMETRESIGRLHPYDLRSVAELPGIEQGADEREKQEYFLCNNKVYFLGSSSTEYELVMDNVPEVISNLFPSLDGRLSEQELRERLNPLLEALNHLPEYKWITKTNPFLEGEFQLAVGAIESSNKLYSVKDPDRQINNLLIAGYTEGELQAWTSFEKMLYDLALYDIVSVMTGDPSQFAFKAYQKMIDDLPIRDDLDTSVDPIEFLQTDKAAFAQELRVRSKKIIDEDREAKAAAALQERLNSPGLDNTLKRYGQAVLEECQELKQKAGVPLSTLTRTLTVTNRALSIKFSEGNQNQYTDTAAECGRLSTELSHHSRGKRLGLILGGLVGLLLIAACVYCAVQSLGTLAPISAWGISIGANLIAGAVGAVVGLGVVYKVSPVVSQKYQELTVLERNLQAIDVTLREGMQALRAEGEEVAKAADVDAAAVDAAAVVAPPPGES